MTEVSNTSINKTGNNKIRVGISIRHGMADELSSFPPKGIEYCFPDPTRRSHRFIRSPLKSYLWEFAQVGEFDVLEAVLSPVITDSPWVCSLDCFQSAVAFSFLKLPLPRSLRVQFVGRLLRKENCKKIIFWSEAARRTLVDYGRVNETKILEKTTVVYPAIREVPAEKIRYSDEKVSLLFSGDFFRKGGVNVVDVFEELQKRFPGITLRICCDEKIDFNTSNHQLKAKYLGKIRSNRSILFGRIPRHQMLEDILPETDIYLLPTYNEAFGFAILEAMAYGIPVIATNQFAIPEILQDGRSGLLVDISQYDVQKMFRGYAVHELPEGFRQHINEQLRSHLESLIESAELRERIGRMALSQVQTKFSFKTRNQIMGKIYHDAAN